uniref:Uncharacterized protein n=1 Tax=Planktothricoides sp. SpSt-374 TaxID=2282167 RepID=A0A7C3VI95_9CYAN
MSLVPWQRTKDKGQRLYSIGLGDGGLSGASGSGSGLMLGASGSGSGLAFGASGSGSGLLTGRGGCGGLTTGGGSIRLFQLVI